MPRVWVPRAAGHTFDAAKKYGEIIFVFDEVDSVFTPDLLRARAEVVLADFWAGDYLLLNGPLLMNAVVYAYIQEHHDAFNLLLFHAKLNQYLERTVRACPKKMMK